MSKGLSLDVTLERGSFTLAVDRTLPLDGITALIGRSGAGKTTLLRIIAGLETAFCGTVRFGDEIWRDEVTNRPVHQRGIAPVFQSPTLFSHLSVRENINYGRRWMDAAALAATPVDPLIASLGVADLLDRAVAGLSGGEQRRVALARALATGPRLILLDEPLSGLDEESKHSIIPFLRRALTQAGCPALFVSHDATEALSLADHQFRLKDGRLDALPPLPPILHAEITGGEGADISLRCEGVDFTLPRAVIAPAMNGDGVGLRIDPRQALITSKDPGDVQALFKIRLKKQRDSWCLGETPLDMAAYGAANLSGNQRWLTVKSVNLLPHE